MNLIVILIGVIIGLALIYISIYNSIISSKNRVEKTKSGIDVFLQNRYDLIPNLIETVKKYMEHEKGVLTELTKLRTELVKTSGEFTKDRFEKENQLSQALKSIFAVAESYPDLKANQNFIQLQNQWAEIEDNIAAARRIYNSSVEDLNNKVQMIPYCWVASTMNIPKYDYFAIKEYAEKPIDAKELFNN